MASAGEGVRGGSRLVRERQAWVFFVCVFVFHQIGLRARVCEGRLSDHWTRWCVLVSPLSCALYGCRTHRACPFEGMFFRQMRSVGRSVVSVVSVVSVAREGGMETRRQSASIGRRAFVGVGRLENRVAHRVVHRSIHHSFIR